jgi:hypothetical protein
VFQVESALLRQPCLLIVFCLCLLLLLLLLLQVSGVENAEFVAFSGKALKAAQARLKSFLALLPSDQMQAAQQQIASQEL